MRTGKRNSSSQKVALCGVFGALALTLMLSGGILPAATFVAPAFAGILIVPAAIEFGMPTGYVLYAAIGLLSFFLVPDKEMSLIFLFFLGFYPLLKANLERIRCRFLRVAAKFTLFNGCILVMYTLLLAVFPLPSVTADFEGTSSAMLAALLILANVTFALYDVAIARIIGLYCAKIRPRLLRLH